ncbi:hypothetical protein EN828_27120 [Mesorhizobium sp. M2D.F.Ca.ET.185.01.1.1]|uniref:hypothetical protein n=1 Tax=unclassified Mesorhizobium TaxID=325217 RepID=UPI000FC9D8C5|nr:MULTISPECIES: hypothetical protein [unclassified Mesorhizobium]TGP49688.1 hypothetical protein EN873_27455 [bacterium M00.F.Ca.ET.230.01.1.1]TGP74756.1 hypothetical protein EN870_26150 [bacterium M00.F.Ca.ET.227.01.1.1]TGP84651.1 hypothetical protein EN864_28955 [bacterium M00.F.Ca.ET.221.01.1.1]TGP87710.1 hypothetical protein EN865_28255 [bacterium M00.F.Ca.ET.222.01.1.1]TGT97122.1 hypothetical protein EN806_50115 [bacterium M00.F.Ca.ET.163.01.1.1]TGU21757.1 hypothetical protein EN799_530
MLTKILAASALTIGLATAALAQTANSTDGAGGSGQSITVDPRTPATPPPDQMAPDTGTTGSISGGDMNSDADRNCPNSPQGAQGDANSTTATTVQPNVNDKNCGK